MKTKLKLNLRHIYIFLLMILPIINNYRLLPIAFIYVFGVLGVIMALISHATNLGLKLNFSSIIYFMYVIFVSLFVMAGQPDTGIATIVIKLIYFFLIFLNFYIYAYQVWDFDFAIRIYRSICLIVSVLILFQFALSLIGHPISLIPGGLVANTGERLTTDAIRSTQVSNNRFSTFFLEPAHQAQFTVPCIAILLFMDVKKSKRSDLIISLVLTAGVFATTSMQGILICAIIWALYLYELMKLRGAKKAGRIILLIPLIIAVVIYFLQQPIIQEQIQKKILSFNRGDVYLGTSMYRRIIYGWDCYGQFDWIHKLFGCGYDNVGTYLYRTRIGLQFVSDEQIGYMSGISRMFCEIGLIGALLNFSITIFLIVRNGRKNKMILALLVTWFLIMLTSASFDSLASLIPLTFMMNATMRKRCPDI